MPHTDSILRYPGGKSQLLKFLDELLEFNTLKKTTYIEPFAGGAGLALSLLLNGHVSKIIINDYDVAIWSIWNAVINNTQKLKDFLINEEITIENWKKHKNNYENLQTLSSDSETDQLLSLACSTLFLNRTNISGVIKGGVIGGVQQNGNYKLDCRFNKKTLIKKIDRISSFSKQIELYNLDAVEFINSIVSKQLAETTFVFFDPPYYKKGPELYSNFYTHEDHINLAKTIQNKSYNFYWITTYDNCDEIKAMYNSSKAYLYSLKYSLSKKRNADELMFVSNNLLFKNNFQYIKEITPI